MKHKDRNSKGTTGRQERTVTPTVVSPYAGKPLDGSQYIDVIEEQEYADQRPTAEEQRPRFSYLHDRKT